jgi:DNA-binding transcriptional MerR regulator
LGRYSESVGLLDEPARTPAGYRGYSEQARDQRFIRAAQAVGLSLGEILLTVGVG